MMTGNKDKTADLKQRQHTQLKPGDIPGLQSVELSQGSEIDIVNISREGMLLETATRLRPDLKVVIKVVTSKGPMRIDGIVLRSAICSLTGGPRYRSAVEFKQPLELPGEAIAPSDARGNESVAQSDAGGNAKAAAILTVLAGDNNGVCLKENFSLNNL